MGILVAVVILATALLLPSLRSYFHQQGELAALRDQAQVARTQVDDLQAESARWDDDAYVMAQARERLFYVFPGETPYRVIDPESVKGAPEGSPAAAEQAAAEPDGTWYTRLWGSLEEPSAIGTTAATSPTTEPTARPTTADTATGETDAT